MFRRVLRAIAAETSDAELAATLNEIIDEHLPGLWLDDLPPTQRAEAERIIRDRLMDRLEQETPPDAPNRQEHLDYFRTLPDMLANAAPR